MIVMSVFNLVHMPWLLALLALFMNACTAHMIQGPQNAASIEGLPVTLHCTTSAGDSCRWEIASSLYAIRNGEVLLIIYNGEKTLNSSEYLVNKSQPGQCNLTILRPWLTSPLVYACRANIFDPPSYAGLTVVKSNLQCAHNVPLGTAVAGQTVRYSFHLVYASEATVSVYLDHLNGSVVKVCSDRKKHQGNLTWSLECDHTVTAYRPPTFFAAVSELVDVQGIGNMDKTLPTERLYCSQSDQLNVDDKQADYLDNVTAKVMTSHAPADSFLPSWLYVLLCLSAIVLCFTIGMCCYKRRKNRDMRTRLR